MKGNFYFIFLLNHESQNVSDQITRDARNSSREQHGQCHLRHGSVGQVSLDAAEKNQRNTNKAARSDEDLVSALTAVTGEVGKKRNQAEAAEGREHDNAGLEGAVEIVNVGNDAKLVLHHGVDEVISVFR